ncbi:MAG: hypothetical protein OS130_05825 [Thermodesulfobacteriota bacterium]|nr:MAG: hypothetical protein OS130_05825 [Thermodesulfobacteriota bacterium]
MNPATERLQSKMTNLEEILEGFRAQNLSHEQKHIVSICKTYFEKARGYTDRPLLSAKFPFFARRHPHLVWEFLHRVDEYFILLIKDEELYSRAIDVKASFYLNIEEEKVRAEWVGEKGKLIGILDHIKKREHMEENRYVIRDALNLVNEQMDRTFWQLSMNTLTSVWSGFMLAGLMVLTVFLYPSEALQSLGTGPFKNTFVALIILGLMGAYLSNPMTNENFLYVRGGPFWRYLHHNLFSKPVMSAFSAVFVFILEKSKLIFSINAIDTETPAKIASQIISLNVAKMNEGYVYAVLAIVSGFAADKILRNMIDKVLKRLEQKAEKTKNTEKA